MSGVALALFGSYVILAFGFRSWMQVRSTGDAGFRGVSGRPGSMEWWGGVLFVVALLLGIVSPMASLLASVPWVLSPTSSLAWTGVGVTLTGIGLALSSQRAMGRSWRVGVDPSEKTELVARGPFAVVRNPFFSATFLAAAGLFAMVPNVISLAGVAALVLAMQIQVRVVEEPHLLVTHGEAYRVYAARAGRFVPGLGRLRILPAREAEQSLDASERA